MGLKTPVLLMLGLVRFAVVVVMTIAAAGLVLSYYQDILFFIWERPESAWLVWMWHVVSWLLGILLVGISAVIAFLVAQMVFCVLIMDAMSRITERRISGEEKTGRNLSIFGHFLFLLKQEIPRAIVPVMITLIIMVVGWLTPLSPILTVVTALVAVSILAWDNTDLIPARRQDPFGRRFSFFRRHFFFHLGFGVWFLIPVINMIFLSFAPVGATLYYIEQVDTQSSGTEKL